MKSNMFLLSALALTIWTTAAGKSHAQANPYPAMAPLAQYLMPQTDEIALARSAAPKSVSDGAEVMVLEKQGYVTATKGTNGFLCFVERAWANDSKSSEFWNPRQRAPICFNAAAADSYAQIYLMKTRLVLQGKSKQEVTQAIAAAMDSRELPALTSGSMCYMMSRQQYLNDVGKNWHPHLMFFAPGDVAKSWGADAPDSPLLAANDPEEGVTVFMMLVNHWSDGTPDSAAER